MDGKTQTFYNSFWNPEFCNFGGYEVLCKRMQSGRHVCKDIAEFVKQRAQAEESYGKSLMRLAKTASGKDEIGSLRQGWDCLKVQTESIGSRHVQLGQQLMEEYTKIVQFMDGQKDRRRQVEDGVKADQMNLKAAYKKTTDLKKVYELKSRDADSACNEFEEKKKSATAKEFDKMHLKKLKTKQTVQTADKQYGESVTTLNALHGEWETKQIDACQILQNLEEERIKFLRNAMWVHANLDSELCVARDEMDESIRICLERCDVDADIMLFIQQKATGRVRPDTIKYEKYQSTCVCNQPKSTPGQVYEDFDSLGYSLLSVGADVASNQQLHQHYTVLFDYEAQDEDEMSVAQGDRVRFESDDDDGWWKVTDSHGRSGLVPVSYLEEA